MPGDRVRARLTLCSDSESEKLEVGDAEVSFRRRRMRGSSRGETRLTSACQTFNHQGHNIPFRFGVSAEVEPVAEVEAEANVKAGTKEASAASLT